MSQLPFSWVGDRGLHEGFFSLTEDNMNINVCFAALVSCMLTTAVCSLSETDGKSYWIQQAQQTLQDALSMQPNTKVAHNAILFLGDGMGVSTVTAARIYKGQKHGRPGEETQLHFERFPHVALSKTYNVDKQTSDSAGTATAYLCGVKANMGTIGVDSRVARKSCSSMHRAEVRTQSLMDWAHAAGKSVGIVTTSRITHASPAASFAHTPDRDWETDRDIPSNCEQVKDIAFQLLKENDHIQVMLGGGRREFYNRNDNRSLPEEWVAAMQAKGLNAQYVRNAGEFRAVSSSEVDHLLGLFAESHMSYQLARDNEAEPSLVEMITKAIDILSKNSRGFFLFVEGGRIDHGHHANKAKNALEETATFDDAITAASAMVGDDTLMVVTADHSHVFNIAGYPTRGNNILGVVDDETDRSASDGKPYTAIVYGNGPGSNRTHNLTNADTTADDYQFQRAVPMTSETHGGEDVAIFATGPMAHLFHGVHEQNYIAHVMAYAMCVGPNTDHCEGRVPGSGAGGMQGRLGLGSLRQLVLVVVGMAMMEMVVVGGTRSGLID